MSQTEVIADLVRMGNNKARLMQHYSDEQKKVLAQYGGNLSDIPMEREHPFHKLQDKINLLGKM